MRTYILIGFDGEPPSDWQGWLLEHMEEIDELQLRLTPGELADFGRRLLIASELTGD